MPKGRHRRSIVQVSSLIPRHQATTDVLKEVRRRRRRAVQSAERLSCRRDWHLGTHETSHLMFARTLRSHGCAIRAAVRTIETVVLGRFGTYLGALYPGGGAGKLALSAANGGKLWCGGLAARGCAEGLIKWVIVMLAA